MDPLPQAISKPSKEGLVKHTGRDNSAGQPGPRRGRERKERRKRQGKKESRIIFHPSNLKNTFSDRKRTSPT